MNHKRLFVILLVAPFAGPLAASAEEAIDAKLAARLRTILPDAAITSVKPAPIAGLYEVMLGPTVLYMSPDAKYVFKGDLIDLDGRVNLTDQRRTQARVAAFHQVGDTSAITFAATGGKTKHSIYVFTDIDCGYCRKMHQQIKVLNAGGVTVNYLAFPRTGLDSESYDKAVAVWCATDPKVALTDAKAGKRIKNAKCDNPVAKHFHLGEAMGVQGTPAVYSEAGEELGGYIPAQELIHILDQGG
jgi:thiol:disulfide interchange protein DsbC